MTAAYWGRARRILTWKHWAWATALGTLVGVLVPLQNLHLNFYFTLGKILYQGPIYVVFAWVFVSAIVLVEASVPAGRWPSFWRYFCGTVASSVVCVGLAVTFPEQFRQAPRRVISGGSAIAMTTFSAQHRRNSAVVEIGFDGIVHGWLATFIYAGLRRSRRAARVLAEAEIGRSEAQRSLLAAQLASHAEVDPELVMQRLEAIEETYESDPAAADGQLDELIAFLRDAIPRLRLERVTWAIECRSSSSGR